MDENDSAEDMVAYWRNVFHNFSKHVQGSTHTPQQSRWMLQVLQAVVGDRETIRRLHPLTFLLCPLSPLALKESYTDACLETITAGYNVPVAVMPMPLMGVIGPGSLIYFKKLAKRPPRFWRRISACRWKKRSSVSWTESSGERATPRRDDNMQFQAKVLSKEDQYRVHQQSLRILMDVGVRFYSEAALKVLAANGAPVNWESQITKIPPELVERALQTAPQSFVLEARNPRFNFPLPSTCTGYVMDGTGAFAVDWQTGEKRYGTRQDIENAMRVFQHLDMGVMAWAPTCAADAPSSSRALHEFFAVLKYCSKHGQHELHRVAQVPFFIAGLKAMLGSKDAIRANKICSLIYCPVAPLVHDGEMCSAYLELGQYDIPITVMPMPVAGTTGPASLFSNICLANAEALSALVVFQLANPGRPMIYANAIGALDFSSGAFLAATPEVALQAAALIAMGRFYNLPTASTGCSTDARQPGPEAVLEKLISSISPALAGADLIVGIGEIESDQTLVLEQMVVDNEIAHLCCRLREGINTGEEQDLFEDIAQVGPGGHFMKRKSTRQAARSGEFYIPALIDRHTYEAWLNLGRPSMYSKARERVREILASPVADPLPDDVAQELDEILLAADREIKEH